MFLQDKNYDFEKHKKCLFFPQWGLRFGEKDDLVLLISLNTNQMKALSNNHEYLLEIDPFADQLKDLINLIISQGNTK